MPRRAIYSTLAENQLLLTTQPDYLANIVASAIRPGQLEAWTKGSWTISSGGMFDGDWPEASKHCVLPPIPPAAIPPSWRITAAFDWGDSKPFAWIWAAISDGSPIVFAGGRVLPFIRGDYVIFDELYGCHPNQPDTGVRWSIDQIKRAGIAKEIDSGLRYQDPMTGQLDQARAHRRRRQHDLQSEAGERHRRPRRQHGRRVRRGCHLRSRSPARRAAGSRPTKVPAAACKAGKPCAACCSPPIPNKNGARENPGLFITANCVHWIQTVPVLPRDLDGNPEDIPDRVEDHLADATRYLIRRTNRPAIRSGRVRI